MAVATFRVQGMNCSGCARSIEHRLKSTAGVSAAVVDFEEGTATVTFDDAVTTADSLEKVIETLGFDVVYGMGRGPRAG